jgi:hypothetical protein
MGDAGEERLGTRSERARESDNVGVFYNIDIALFVRLI